jgi:hypothetical protein
MPEEKRSMITMMCLNPPHVLNGPRKSTVLLIGELAWLQFGEMAM